MKDHEKALRTIASDIRICKHKYGFKDIERVAENALRIIEHVIGKEVLDEDYAMIAGEPIIDITHGRKK